MRLDSRPGNLCLTLNEDYRCTASDFVVGDYGRVPVHVGRRDGPNGHPESYINLVYVEKLVAERDRLLRRLAGRRR